ncbi:TonB-dependent receptor [Terriglobus saanensis]|uniref:TonB-dependent receptor plug n=1 Tax=Terriglobus saanensis (strain ATCC BAA-1853 / DSM 23119 / SP1PR4) TaxID=401053 RepID=E8V1Y4_TERSS|nr:TonB-dependent receptor [Terriglobus saanensis]ADV83472.1 TonB-dependent receptor plug [Terriglobus saanensis SP1PR4]
MNSLLRTIGAAVLILAPIEFSSLAHAQVLYGTLVGTVADPSGKSVPGATVIATEVQTGTEHRQTTNGDGGYDLRDLLPGVYKVQVTASGFSQAEQTGLNIRANLIVRVDEKLSVAGTSQTVEVNASNTELQTDSGTIHGELTTRELSNIPIGGFNNYQSLLSLLPGATPSRYQNSVMDTPSRSLTTNINGSSRNNNETAVDGAAIQQVYLPHHTLYNPPTEDIQSVDIVTNSFTAEQGLAGGAVVSVLTKSGTNQFHGTLWEENTNSALAARNYFYNKTYFSGASSSAPKNILNQFGANIGGPILHNKLFFFSGFEGLSQRQLYPEIVSVPTDAERNGDFTGLAALYDPNTGNSDGTGRATIASKNIDGRNAIESGISPAAQRVLALIPHANLPGTSNNLSVAGTYSLDRFSFDEKINWQINPKSSMFAKLSYLRADVMSPSTLGIGGGTGLSPGGSNSGSGYSQTRIFIGGIGYTRTLSQNILFDANFGVGHNDLAWYEADFARNLGPGLGIPGTNSDGNGSYGTDPNQAGLPSFAVTGLETFGNPDAYTPELKNDFTYTYVGNLTWVVGSHTMRFGTQMLNNHLNQYQPQRGFGPRGGFTFTGGVTALKGGASPTSANAFAQFLLGLPDSLGKSYQFENPISETEWQYGVYAQDQWQASHRLTLTYGLRWELYPIMSGMDRYDFTTNRMVLGGTNGQPTGAGSNASKLQFAPRFGFAYRIDDKTVLRGGYGISIDPYPFTRAMRDPYPVTIAQTINANNSYVAAGNFVTGIPGYATVAPAIGGDGTVALPLTAYTKTLPAGNFRRGYVQSMNFTVERSLPAGFDLTASYVGTQTIRQTTYFEANAGQTPGLGAAGQPLYAAFGRNAETQVILPYNTAHYDGLQFSLKHPFKHGVLLTTSYTYSKSLDEASDDDSVPLFNAVAYQYRNRAVSDFDRKHVFDMGFTAELPFGKGHAFLRERGIASAIIGGWKVNAVISKYTGLPFTPVASATSLNAAFNTQVANQISPHVATLHGIGKFSTWFDTSAFAPVTTSSFGTANRNSLRGPGDADLDLGISRDFPLKERLHLELRGEAFNLTNTPNFAVPANNVSNSNFGQITSTFGSAADSRIIRFTGKLNF